jgi:superfamily II DNA or RNA helicase
VLQDMIAENPKQQIMVIASYKNILNYFYEAINFRNIATVGYYVGGMKEAALKNSETKQIVLATFSMAAEGLDIKSLTTLFMVTPMTNIEQSVGRILRQKHEFAAVVVDLIDTHDNFQRQWSKRKAFYKKQNYKIIQTNSTIYQPDVTKWKKIYEPTLCTTAITNEISDSSEEEIYEEEIVNESNEKVKPKGGVCLLKMKK